MEPADTQSPGPSPAPQRESALESGGGAAIEAPRPVVLVVDDEPDVRSAVADVLNLGGYVALTATNGHDALKKLRAASSQAPEVILLDYMMPVMNGIEFRQAQLGDPALARIPVILISALRLPEVADLRFAASLTKPFEVPALLDAVHRALHQARVAGKA